MDYEVFLGKTEDDTAWVAFVARTSDLKQAILRTSTHPDPQDAAAELCVMYKGIKEALERAAKAAMRQ